MSFLNNYIINKNIRKDLIILLITISLPFVFFIYLIVPETKVWYNDWFIIDSGYFESAKFFIWFITVKLMTIVLLSIWFVTCKYLWRYIIFVPIAAEVHKLYVLLKIYELNYEYKPHLLETILITIPFLVILLLISKKIGYYRHAKINTNVVNDEINSQMAKLSKFDSGNYKFVKQKLVKLLNEKDKMSKKEYLIKLIALRDRLTS